MCKAIDLTGNTYGRLTVIGLSYTEKKHRYWKCKCSCGSYKDVRGDQLRSGEIKSCGCLRNDTLRNIAMKNLVDMSGQTYGSLTVECFDRYEDRCGPMWNCVCACGNRVTVSREYLLSPGNHSCGCKLHGSTLKFVPHQDLTGMRFGKLVVIGNPMKHIGGKFKWECMCDCGRTHYVESYKLTHGITNSCGMCGFKSAGEVKIAKLLDDNNIPYEREKKFDGCINSATGQQYRFDFYVDNKYVIEYDGEQHFKHVQNWDENTSLEERQRHDIEKDEWCEDHEIPLIRIPYSDIDNITIDDLKLETSDNFIYGWISGWAYLVEF